MKMWDLLKGTRNLQEEASTAGVSKALLRNTSTRADVEAEIIGHEVSRARQILRGWGKSRTCFLALVGVSGASLVLSLYESAGARSATSEVKRRREQLVKPVHELKDNEVVNFPWAAKDKVNEWLFRPVQISGRPNHSRAMLIPRTVDNYPGYDYIVPLITKETEDGSEEWGVLLNKGWIPHEYNSPSKRYKIEDVSPQTFVGYVSKNTELEDSNNHFTGNAPAKGRNNWSHLYLPDMAKATGFKNADQCKWAVIECVNLDSPLDERNPRHYNMDMTQSIDYPFKKNKAGALQMPMMSWDHERWAKNYLTWSIVFGAVAAVAKVI